MKIQKKKKKILHLTECILNFFLNNLFKDRLLFNKNDKV